MADRYFIEHPIQGDRATLEAAEAHHLLHVMRAKTGDSVVLFDGTGGEFAAEVLHAGRSTVELAVLSRIEVDRELPLAITLGVALPKGDRQKWLVEKLTELGVSTLVPLETRRSVAQPRESALDRLRRSVVEASKQCGRNRLMKIESPQTLDTFVRDTRTNAQWFAHPGGNDIASALDVIRKRSNSLQSIAIAVGPEGGFTDEESATAAQADWQLVGLGIRILRVETAAMALAAYAGMLAR